MVSGWSPNRGLIRSPIQKSDHHALHGRQLCAYAGRENDATRAPNVSSVYLCRGEKKTKADTPRTEGVWPHTTFTIRYKSQCTGRISIISQYMNKYWMALLFLFIAKKCDNANNLIFWAVSHHFSAHTVINCGFFGARYDFQGYQSMTHTLRKLQTFSKMENVLL